MKSTRIRIITVLVFLLVCNLPVLARNVSISFRNVTIQQALELLQAKEGYSFIFKSGDVSLSEKVNHSFQDASIKSVMEYLFRGQNLTFEIDGTRISISKLENSSTNVSGKVLDHDGFPLPGAGVLIKDTNTGVVTDMDGEFSIDIANDGVLAFKCLGYEDMSVKVAGRQYITVRMKAEVNDLDEAVVVGYGSIKKSDLTGAIASVKAKDLPKSSSTSVLHMLSGKAAGLTVTQNSAQPGGGVSVLVRGAGSTGAGNTPLYIIDGFPVSNSSVEPSTDNRYSNFGSRNPLNSINPNDIESIEILKDASSTAIYGARAANGVIIITTKNGHEGHPVVNYNASYSTQRISNKIRMMNAAEYMQAANSYAEEKWYHDNRVYPYGDNDPDDFKTKPLYPYTQAEIDSAGEGTPWYDLITQNGMVNQHNISVSGGSKGLKYLASFNYYDQNGVVKNSDLTRKTVRVNIDHKLNDYFSYGIHLTRSNINTANIALGDGNFQDSGLLMSAMCYDPTIPVFDSDGKYYISPLMANVPNPVSMLEIDDHTITKRFLASAYAQVDFLKHFNFKVTYGVDDQSGIRSAYLPTTTLYGLQEGGKATKSYSGETDNLIEATLGYNAISENGAHKINAIVGYSYQELHYENFRASNSQFFTDVLKFNSLGTGEAIRPIVGSYKSEEKLSSWIGRVNYTLLDRYLFTLTGRIDGSSKFGINNRYGFFPSCAFAWKINNEDFMKDIQNISELKFRVSLGQTGNSNIGNNAFEYYAADYYQYIFDKTVNIGAVKYQMANPDLKWETTSEINLGIDFGMFDQRIAFTGEYFMKEIKDLLGYQSLASFMEVSTVAANVGKTKSSGIELSLKTRNFVGEFTWDTDLTFTSYRDIWKEHNPEDILSPWCKPNDPIRALYGYIPDGILQAGEEAPSYMPELLPGEYKIKDVNGYVRDEAGNLVMGNDGKVQYMETPDGRIDEADIVLLGTSDPGFSMGFGNTFTYKGFDLNIYFYGMFDRVVNNATRGAFSIPEIRRILNGQNMLYEVNKRWTKDTQDSKLPSGFTNVYPTPDYGYLWEKAWFVRCKNITLGYTLPIALVEKIFNNARVYFDCQNPFVFTTYSGNDPETDSMAAYPAQKSFTIGIDLTF